eukprot:3130877-Amphidinium_carterae.1
MPCFDKISIAIPMVTNTNHGVVQVRLYEDYNVRSSLTEKDQRSSSPAAQAYIATTDRMAEVVWPS